MSSRRVRAVAGGILRLGGIAGILVALIIAGQQARPAAGAPASAGNATFSIYMPMLFKPSGGTVPVALKSISYIPSSVTVPVGTKVVWTNDESFPIDHTVTSGSPGTPSGVFDSPTLSQGQSFNVTFTTAGTFNYYCRIHLAAMTGTVTVTP